MKAEELEFTNADIVLLIQVGHKVLVASDELMFADVGDDIVEFTGADVEFKNTEVVLLDARVDVTLAGGSEEMFVGIIDIELVTDVELTNKEYEAFVGKLNVELIDTDVALVGIEREVTELELLHVEQSVVEVMFDTYAPDVVFVNAVDVELTLDVVFSTCEEITLDCGIVDVAFVKAAEVEFAGSDEVMLDATTELIAVEVLLTKADVEFTGTEDVLLTQVGHNVLDVAVDILAVTEIRDVKFAEVVKETEDEFVGNTDVLLIHVGHRVSVVDALVAAGISDVRLKKELDEIEDEFAGSADVVLTQVGHSVLDVAVDKFDVTGICEVKFESELGKTDEFRDTDALVAFGIDEDMIELVWRVADVVFTNPEDVELIPGSEMVVFVFVTVLDVPVVEEFVTGTIDELADVVALDIVDDVELLMLAAVLIDEEVADNADALEDATPEDEFKNVLEGAELEDSMIEVKLVQVGQLVVEDGTAIDELYTEGALEFAAKLDVRALVVEFVEIGALVLEFLTDNVDE